jgi:addiction module RelE/StbE family toxin
VSYQLYSIPYFERRLRKFRREHPELRHRLARVLQDLESDPHQPHLNLHPLRGNLRGRHAVRVTYSFRIVLTILVSEREITLLDIGSHDEVYRD